MYFLAHWEGNKMAQWILKTNGHVVPWQPLCLLNTAKVHSFIEIHK